MGNNSITESDIWAYIAKTSDEVITRKVEKWINSDDYDQILFEEVYSVFKLTENNFGHDKIDVESSKKKFFISINRKRENSNNWKKPLKYAAVVAFMVFSTTYFYKTNSDRIVFETAYGEQKKINLPDKSIIWLNSSSAISYSKKHPRTVYLEGEAFFDVVKDVNNPFTVHTTSNIQVKVLGTTFNVKSYKANNFLETSLFTGKVKLISDKHFDEKIFMRPNDKIVFDKTSNQIIKSVLINSEDTVAWKLGKIQFSNKPFKAIAKDLDIQFNIKINFENEKIASSKFTGSFNNTTPIEEILEILKATKYFEYKQSSENKWVIK